MYLPKTNEPMSFVFTFLALCFGGLILFVSIARAGLEIMAQGNNTDKVRVNLVNFVITNDDGSTEPVSYKLPEINMLPTSSFYGFKYIRDWLWINLSRTPLEKSKVLLLVADKKIAESSALFIDNLPNQAMDAATEALVKLKYAQRETNNIKKNTDEVKQLNLQIVRAGLAYKEILQGVRNTFEVDINMYNNLISDLDAWNESQKTERN